MQVSSPLAGIAAVAPLLPVIAVLGVVLGHASRTAGMSAGSAVALSAVAFSGSAQFAAIAVLAAGGSIPAAALAAALLSSRYLATGATVARHLHGAAWRRVLVAQLVVDETWAVAYQGSGRFDFGRLAGAAAALWLVHVGATAVGATLDLAMRDPESWGLDAAFPALFVALLRPTLRSADARRFAVIGAAIALALVPVLPSGLPLLAAAAVTLVLPARRAEP